MSTTVLPGNLADELRAEIDAAETAFRSLTEADAALARAPGKWTRKEILGHLIDSAVNNHQRFVRAQLADSLTFPGYQQNEWVDVQRYRDRPWTELLELWSVLNRHLTHVIESVPASKHGTRCVIGTGEPVTLEFLMRDYVRHLRHHLAQLRM